MESWLDTFGGQLVANTRAVMCVPACLPLPLLLFMLSWYSKAEGLPGGISATTPERNGTKLSLPGEPLAQEDLVSDEVRLVRFLLDKYQSMGKIARPTYNSSAAVPVWFGLRLIQLELDEREQLMKSSVWVRYRWVDEYLKWDPDLFGGLNLITLPWDQVWVPDIVLVNTASTAVAERAADIMVSHEGFVFWSPHRLYKSGCLIDISNYPFDHHTCDLWFQSMSHYSWHLYLQPFPKSPWDLQTYLASYKESQGWEIVMNKTDKFDANRRPGLILKFSKRVTLLFSLTVNRRPGYTCHLLMLPCVFLGALTLVVFCLPPERPDRITLAMSLFGSFLVLLLILVEAAPPSAASVPQLGLYYACNMVLIMTSVFLSAIVVNVSRGGEKKRAVPRWMRIVFLEVIARPILLRDLIDRTLGPKSTRKPWRKEKNGYHHPGENSHHQGDQDSYMALTHPLGDEARSEGSEDRLSTRNFALLLDERLQRMESQMSRGNDPDYKRMVNEWKMVGMVMDRLFFSFYIVGLVLSAVFFFPRPGGALS